MPFFCPLADTLPAEHRALCREYAAVQARCSQLIAQQRAEIEQLQAQVLRLRAQALMLTTALAWKRADCAVLHLTAAQEDVQAPVASLAQPERAPCPRTPLESSLAEANLVLCQVGCLSHGAYWRDAHDQCRRSGQTCVMVQSAGALQAAAVTAMPAPAMPPV